MPEKKQTMRYNEQELEIVKNTFAENEDLIKAIRKVFWQFPLTAIEQSIISINLKGDALKVLRKTFLPELEGTAPLHQVIDLWMTVKIEDKTPEEARPHLKARQTLIDYLDQQLKRLEDPKSKEKIKFNELLPNKNKLPEDNYSDLTARNTLISHIEMQLTALMLMAGLKNESVEETQERLKKDSSK